jgi:hypothetical protein
MHVGGLGIGNGICSVTGFIGVVLLLFRWPLGIDAQEEEAEDQ